MRSLCAFSMCTCLCLLRAFVRLACLYVCAGGGARCRDCITGLFVCRALGGGSVVRRAAVILHFVAPLVRCRAGVHKHNKADGPYWQYYNGHLSPYEVMFTKLGGKVLREGRLKRSLIDRVEQDTDLMYAALARVAVCGVDGDGTGADGFTRPIQRLLRRAARDVNAPWLSWRRGGDAGPGDARRTGKLPLPASTAAQLGGAGGGDGVPGPRGAPQADVSTGAAPSAGALRLQWARLAAAAAAAEDRPNAVDAPVDDPGGVGRKLLAWRSTSTAPWQQRLLPAVAGGGGRQVDGAVGADNAARMAMSAPLPHGDGGDGDDAQGGAGDGGAAEGETNVDRTTPDKSTPDKNTLVSTAKARAVRQATAACAAWQFNAARALPAWAGDRTTAANRLSVNAGGLAGYLTDMAAHVTGLPVVITKEDVPLTMPSGVRM